MSNTDTERSRRLVILKYGRLSDLSKHPCRRWVNHFSFLLTDTIPRSFSKRQICEIRTFSLLFRRKSFWIEDMWFWVVPWIMMYAMYRYRHHHTWFNSQVSTRYLILFSTNSCQHRRWCILPQCLCKTTQEISCPVG